MALKIRVFFHEIHVHSRKPEFSQLKILLYDHFHSQISDHPSFGARAA